MDNSSINLCAEIQEERLSDGAVVFVSYCPELGVSSQGVTIEEATANLVEAVMLWFGTASKEEILTALPMLHPKKSQVYTTRIEVPYGQIANLVGC